MKLQAIIFQGEFLGNTGSDVSGARKYFCHGEIQ